MYRLSKYESHYTVSISVFCIGVRFRLLTTRTHSSTQTQSGSACFLCQPTCCRSAFQYGESCVRVFAH